MNSDSTMTYCPWRTYRISINALYFNDVQISRSGRTWSSHLSFSFFFSPFFFWINKSVAPWETFPTKWLCYKVLQNAMRYLLSRVTANWAGGPDCDLWIRQKQQCCVRACCWFYSTVVVGSIVFLLWGCEWELFWWFYVVASTFILVQSGTRMLNEDIKGIMRLKKGTELNIWPLTSLVYLFSLSQLL